MSPLSGSIIGIFALLKVLDNVEHADVGAEEHSGRPEEENEQVLPQLPLEPGLLFSDAVRFHDQSINHQNDRIDSD